jgi:hypothetical protein
VEKTNAVQRITNFYVACFLKAWQGSALPRCLHFFCIFMGDWIAVASFKVIPEYFNSVAVLGSDRVCPKVAVFHEGEKSIEDPIEI